jgi:hypothetical protein
MIMAYSGSPAAAAILLDLTFSARHTRSEVIGNSLKVKPTAS